MVAYLFLVVGVVGALLGLGGWSVTGNYPRVYEFFGWFATVFSFVGVVAGVFILL